MSTLTLVRHGQATPFEKVSDQLSAIGETQARRLAEFWMAHGVTFDEAFCGTLTRQRRTAEIVADIFAANALDFPAVAQTAELNEYDADGILKRLAPALAERDAAFKQLADDYQAHRETPARNRHFQRLLEAAMQVWLRGEMELEEVESLTHFSQRVRGVIERITQGGSGTGSRRVVVFTSGGVIGFVVQTALAAPAAQALEINWRVRNCSLTEFLFSGKRFSLDSFNALPHLARPQDRHLWTFR